MALAPADVADLLLPELAETVPSSPLHDAILSTLDSGALFFRQLTDRAGTVLLSQDSPAPSDQDVITALWDLVWAGLVTNDTIGPLRALVSGRGAAHKPRTARPTRAIRPNACRAAGDAEPSRAADGRRALVAGRGKGTDPTRRAHARAEAFLERHGVLTRGALDTERVSGGFSAVYRVLRAMEESGQVIRGYVVEGLGAAQFAARGAVDRLRAQSRTTGQQRPIGDAVVLAAADPAQPYGAALSWPDPIGAGKHRPARKAGALAVLVDGVPVFYVERGGRSLLSFTEDDDALRTGAQALSRAVREGWLGQLAVQRADGEGALTSHLAEVLRESGFRATPKGLRLRA